MPWEGDEEDGAGRNDGWGDCDQAANENMKNVERDAAVNLAKGTGKAPFGIAYKVRSMKRKPRRTCGRAMIQERVRREPGGMAKYPMR